MSGNTCLTIMANLGIFLVAVMLLPVPSVAMAPHELEITSSMGEMPYHPLLERVERYILPLMPFWYEDLDPHINEPTLTAHHMGEHNVHKSFTNKALREWREEEPDNALAKDSILKIVMNLEQVPMKYRTVLRNHGGGFVNHCFVFGVMSMNEAGKEREPTGQLLKDIEKYFGSYGKFKELFNEQAKNHFGSGYVWLNRAPDSGSLSITTTNNQDSPVMAGLHPILVLDLWEHSYYLKHNYRRWQYVSEWWKVVDWEYVADLDKWWVELDEEQDLADKRVQELRDSLQNRLDEETKMEAKKQAKKEEDEKKKKEEVKEKKEEKVEVKEKKEEKVEVKEKKQEKVDVKEKKEVKQDPKKETKVEL